MKKNNQWLKKAASLSVAALIAGGASGADAGKKIVQESLAKQIQKKYLIDKIQVQGEIRNIHQIDFNNKLNDKLLVNIKKGEFIRVSLLQQGIPEFKGKIKIFSEKGNDKTQKEWILQPETAGMFQVVFAGSEKDKKPDNQCVLEIVVVEETIIDIPLNIDDMDKIPIHLKPGYPEGTRYGIIRKKNLKN